MTLPVYDCGLSGFGCKQTRGLRMKLDRAARRHCALQTAEGGFRVSRMARFRGAELIVDIHEGDEMQVVTRFALNLALVEAFASEFNGLRVVRKRSTAQGFSRRLSDLVR